MSNLIDQAIRSGDLAHRSQLSDPQYDVLLAAHVRDTNLVERGFDASASTLRSLAAKRLGYLQYDNIGARKVITGIQINLDGWVAFSQETARRREAAAVAARAEVPAPSQDPFAVHRSTAEYRRDQAIEAAFAI